MNPDNNNPNRYEMDNNSNSNHNTKKTQIKQNKTMTTKALVFVCPNSCVCGSSSKSFILFFLLLHFRHNQQKWNCNRTELSLFQLLLSKFFHAHGCCGTVLVVIFYLFSTVFGLSCSFVRSHCIIVFGYWECMYVYAISFSLWGFTATKKICLFRQSHFRLPHGHMCHLLSRQAHISIYIILYEYIVRCTVLIHRNI